MYPKVYQDYVEHVKKYGDVSRLPTTTFFYGTQAQEEIAVEIDQGKSLVIRLQGRSEIEADGSDRLFYWSMGQPPDGCAALAGAKAAPARPPRADGRTRVKGGCSHYVFGGV